MVVITCLLLTGFSFAIATHPQTTTAPSLGARQVINSICGYGWQPGTFIPITCSPGTSCAIATTTMPAVKFCSNPDDSSDVPPTTVFAYGQWPANGCASDQVCCPEVSPSAAIFTFDGGKTWLPACEQSAFTSPAFESNGATPSFQTTPTSTTPVVGAGGSSSSPTAPVATSSSSSTSASADPTSSSAGSTSSPTTSSGKTTIEVVVIFVLGTIAVTFFAIFCHFLVQIYKVRRSQYTPVAQTSENPNSPSQPEKGLSKWSKIAGIVSPCITLAALGLALFVAFR